MYKVIVKTGPDNYQELLRFECTNQILASIIGETVFSYYKEDFAGCVFGLQEETWVSVESYS